MKILIIIQILLLMNLTTANSYMISQTNDLVIEKRKSKSIFEKGLNLLKFIFSLKMGTRPHLGVLLGSFVV